MKKDKEFEREDLTVDRDIQLDSNNKQQIVAYLETLFDVNEKFNLQLDSEAGEWVNMYGIYNPLSDFLTVECVISKDNSSESFFYTPTTAESALIKELIAEKIKEEFGQTPTEFVCDLAHQEEKAYLYYNRKEGCYTDNAEISQSPQPQVCCSLEVLRIDILCHLHPSKFYFSCFDSLGSLLPEHHIAMYNIQHETIILQMVQYSRCFPRCVCNILHFVNDNPSDTSGLAVFHHTP